MAAITMIIIIVAAIIMATIVTKAKDTNYMDVKRRNN